MGWDEVKPNGKNKMGIGIIVAAAGSEKRQPTNRVIPKQAKINCFVTDLLERGGLPLSTSEKRATIYYR